MKEELAPVADQLASGSSFNPLWIVAVIAAGTAIIGLGAGLVKIGKWIGSVNSDRTGFNKLARDIRKDIKRVLRVLDKSASIGKGSPLRLTELGEKLAAEVQAAEIVHDLADKLSPEVFGKDEYEVQEWCFDFMIDRFAPADTVEARIRKSAYENGVDRDRIMDVLAVMLRDRLLAAQSQETIFSEMTADIDKAIASGEYQIIDQKSGEVVSRIVEHDKPQRLEEVLQKTDTKTEAEQ